MTFDCSEYFTLRFIYTSTLIANFGEKVSWHKFLAQSCPPRANWPV